MSIRPAVRLADWTAVTPISSPVRLIADALLPIIQIEHLSPPPPYPISTLYQKSLGLSHRKASCICIENIQTHPDHAAHSAGANGIYASVTADG